MKILIMIATIIWLGLFLGMFAISDMENNYEEE